MKKNIKICTDPAELDHTIADLFMDLALESIERYGRFMVAVSGGHTPKGLFKLLVESPYNHKIPWASVQVFWADERCVPPNDQDSNYKLVYDNLLSHINIPSANIHRMEGEINPETAADKYQAQLISSFDLTESEVPRFNLILLGMGEDGHTASLFPGTSALNEKKSLVIAHYVEKLQTFRITLTFPVINNAENVIFQVAGIHKAEILKQVLEGTDSVSQLPSRGVRPHKGMLMWLIDEAAASKLSPDLGSSA